MPIKIGRYIAKSLGCNIYKINKTLSYVAITTLQDYQSIRK